MNEVEAKLEVALAQTEQWDSYFKLYLSMIGGKAAEMSFRDMINQASSFARFAIEEKEEILSIYTQELD